ncbi:uncharacterized protein LOC111302682 [Durio zibethinus]|uniref:Uncharacterized protein LOC111302682 n=1 Tax=Durio zibethinus TaxID=66656 RepID=A0A6P5ZP95_DURZI|nr:uncharacterized protein LOC111302682 [Durio zibethinus]
MPSYLWVAAMTAVVACVSAWFGLNLQPFTLNTLRLQRQFATSTALRAPTNVPTPFCFYKLSLQWPPATCNGGMSCKPPTPRHFTIHGIWPQDGNDYPVPPYSPTNPCTPVTPTPASNLPTELNPILSDLQSLWPNLRDPNNLNQNFIFWGHEWTTHGMCSDYPNDPRDYFNSAVLLRKRFNPVQQELPTCNNMSNIPSKPVVIVRQVPTFCPKDDQVMLLHDKSYNKSGESCNNVALQGSVLVLRRHGSDGNEVEALQVDSERERLKRHREEIAGRVLIPDKWDKEELLKDWIDYSSFDSLLAPNGLASARKALMAEGRRTNFQRLRLESMC